MSVDPNTPGLRRDLAAARRVAQQMKGLSIYLVEHPMEPGVTGTVWVRDRVQFCEVIGTIPQRIVKADGSVGLVWVRTYARHRRGAADAGDDDPATKALGGVVYASSSGEPVMIFSRDPLSWHGQMRRNGLMVFRAELMEWRGEK